MIQSIANLVKKNAATSQLYNDYGRIRFISLLFALDGYKKIIMRITRQFILRCGFSTQCPLRGFVSFPNNFSKVGIE